MIYVILKLFRGADPGGEPRGLVHPLNLISKASMRTKFLSCILFYLRYNRTFTFLSLFYFLSELLLPWYFSKSFIIKSTRHTTLSVCLFVSLFLSLSLSVSLSHSVSPSFCLTLSLSFSLSVSLSLSDSLCLALSPSVSL